jgi:hypothetical protein
MIVDGEILGKTNPEAALAKIQARLETKEVVHAS